MRYYCSKIAKIMCLVFLYYPAYILSFLFPRNKNKWVFGSLYGFSDNSKYLFLEVLEKNKEISPFYLIYDKDEYIYLKNTLRIPCLYAKSLKTLFVLATCKVFIGTHGLGFGLPKIFVGKIKYIELWHGIPLKKMGYLDKFSDYKKEKNRLSYVFNKVVFRFNHQYIKRDLFLSVSPIITSLFSNVFGLDESKFVESTYPRCEPFQWKKEKLNSFVSKHEPLQLVSLHEKIHSCNKLFLYMPTFRDADHNFIEKAKIDFDLLNKTMSLDNSLLLLKLHPQTPQKSLLSAQKLSNIEIVPNVLDVYTILPRVDVLITDYSSIFFDFMHNKKGDTIFFPFDYDEYISSSRELAFDYNNHIPGIRVDTFEELLLAIQNQKYIDFDPKRKEELFEFFWGNTEDKVDLVDAIKEVANK